jgi:hypothetical protein
VASKIRQRAVELPPLEGLLAVLADKIHHPLLEGVVEEPGSDGQLGAKGWRGPAFKEKDQPEEQVHLTHSAHSKVQTVTFALQIYCDHHSSINSLREIWQKDRFLPTFRRYYQIKSMVH